MGFIIVVTISIIRLTSKLISQVNSCFSNWISCWIEADITLILGSVKVKICHIIHETLQLYIATTCEHVVGKA